MQRFPLPTCEQSESSASDSALTQRSAKQPERQQIEQPKREPLSLDCFQRGCECNAVFRLQMSGTTVQHPESHLEHLLQLNVVQTLLVHGLLLLVAQLRVVLLHTRKTRLHDQMDVE